MIEKKVIYYVAENGSSPFKDWLKRLDNLSRAIVVRFIQRVATGGAKKTQGRDIEKAKEYWRNYGK